MHAFSTVCRYRSSWLAHVLPHPCALQDAQIRPISPWRVQIRGKGSYVSETFRRYRDAEEWALAAERRIDLGETPPQRGRVDPTTLAHLIDLHIEDMEEVNQATRKRAIQFGRERAREGAGPVTIGMDIGYLKLVVSHAAAVHGIPIQVEPINLARIALKRLGLIAKVRERDRRPTQSELDRLVEYFESNPRQIIPMGRIIRFASPQRCAKTKSAGCCGRTSIPSSERSSCVIARTVAAQSV